MHIMADLVSSLQANSSVGEDRKYIKNIMNNLLEHIEFILRWTDSYSNCKDFGRI